MSSEDEQKARIVESAKDLIILMGYEEELSTDYAIKADGTRNYNEINVSFGPPDADIDGEFHLRRQVENTSQYETEPYEAYLEEFGFTVTLDDSGGEIKGKKKYEPLGETALFIDSDNYNLLESIGDNIHMHGISWVGPREIGSKRYNITINGLDLTKLEMALVAVRENITAEILDRALIDAGKRGGTEAKEKALRVALTGHEDVRAVIGGPGSDKGEGGSRAP